MIEESENRITYLGDGAATEFAIPFSFLEKEDIVVVTVSPESRTETLEKDYFVDADKKAVIYPGYPPGEDPPESERPPVLPAGWKLVIYRNIAVTQKSSLGSIWPFNLIEDGLDKLTMICQDILFSTKRMLKLPESIDEFDPTLPEDLKAGQSIAVNQEGTGWRATRSPEDAADEAADSAAAALASENAARRSEEAAKASEEAAMASQTAAKESEDAAAQSEEAAAISEDAAKASETNAKASETAAADSESAARASEEAAAQSEANAAGSEESASASAQAAAKSQELALASANAAALSEQNAAVSEENAASSEAAAAESAARAEQAAGGVGDPVIKVEEKNGKVTVETANGKKNEFWAGLNILQRNKAYVVGDIAYSASLPSYNYLECVTAGTTGTEEPDFSEVKTGGGDI